MFGAGILLTIVGIGFSRQIFTLLNVGEEVLPYAVTYFNIYMIGMVGFFGFNGTSSVLRGLGDSRTPLRFLAIANVAHGLPGLLFLSVVEWGVAGGGFATVLGRA